MIRNSIKFRWKVALGMTSAALLVMVYLWLSHRQHVFNPKDTTLPNLTQFVEGFKKITTPDGAGEVWLWNDIWATYSRLFIGLLVGVTVSLVIGIAMGCVAQIESFFLPPLSFFAKIPPTAMMAVYFVVFGTELKMFVAMISFGVTPTLAQAVYQSAKKDVTDHAVYKAYTLGASSCEVIWNVVVRQVLPRIIEAVRLQIGPAMVFLIAAEMMVASEGFGYRLRIQSRLLNMNVVYTYLLILGVSGFFIDWLLTFSRKKLCPWFGE